MHKTSINDLKDDLTPKIILLGKSQHGKSTLLKNMLNIDPLDAQIGNEILPYTNQIEISKEKLRGTDVSIMFIDTPGLDPTTDGPHR